MSVSRFVSWVVFRASLEDTERFFLTCSWVLVDLYCWNSDMRSGILLSSFPFVRSSIHSFIPSFNSPKILILSNTNHRTSPLLSDPVTFLTEIGETSFHISYWVRSIDPLLHYPWRGLCFLYSSTFFYLTYTLYQIYFSSLVSSSLRSHYSYRVLVKYLKSCGGRILFFRDTKSYDRTPAYVGIEVCWIYYAVW